jgi:hypothetical protein
LALNRVPSSCSVCGGELEAVRLQCRSCGTALEGHFDVSPFARLTPEQHQFLLLFLKSRGIIKEVERALGLSYPTVRSRLDGLLAALGLVEEPASATAQRRKIDVLNELEAGRITVADALAQLKAIDEVTQ